MIGQVARRELTDVAILRHVPTHEGLLGDRAARRDYRLESTVAEHEHFGAEFDMNARSYAAAPRARYARSAQYESHRLVQDGAYKEDSSHE